MRPGSSVNLKNTLRLFLFIAGNIFAIPPSIYPAPPRDVPQTIERSVPGVVYQVVLPKEFEANKNYPLFIAVHWHTGTAQQQVEAWHKFANRDQYILMAPQFADGYQVLRHQEDQSLLKILESVKTEFPYDPNKVFIVGCSGGAQFAHRFALKYPQLIRAAAVVGAGSYDFPPHTTSGAPQFFVGIGENDRERRALTEVFYRQLLNQGYPVEYKVFPGIGHGCGIDVQQSVTEFLKKIP